jgi:hypothetical protein
MHAVQLILKPHIGQKANNRLGFAIHISLCEPSTYSTTKYGFSTYPGLLLDFCINDIHLA